MEGLLEVGSDLVDAFGFVLDEAPALMKVVQSDLRPSRCGICADSQTKPRARASRTQRLVHLPRFGRVVAMPDAPAAPGLCDDFRPRFGVDVEVLLPDG